MLRCIVLQLFVTTNESFVTSAFAHRAHTHGDTRFVKTQDLLCQVERRHKTLPVLAECRASRGDVDLSDSRASVSDVASSAGNSYWVRVGVGVGERFDHFLANRRRDSHMWSITGRRHMDPRRHMGTDEPALETK